MTLNEHIDRCKEIYENACKTKDIARSSDANINSFKQAAELYGQAASIIFNNILSNSGIDHDTKIRSTALGYYYKFEECDCLYAFNYKNKNFPIAIKYAHEGQIEIDQSIKVIDKEFNSLKHTTQGFLAEMKKNWTASSISIKVKQLEPIAKKAMNDKDYITAFDTYNKMLKFQKELYEYDTAAELDQVYIRIATGNYIAMSANVNQAMAGLLETKIRDRTFSFDLTNDLLGHFLTSLDLSLTAFKANPEWDKYRSGAETIKTNIKKLLEENKAHWFNYLIHHINNSYLKIIMQQTDNDLYKRQSAKLEIENNKTKRFLITGLFWIVLLFSIFYVLLQLATSSISWQRFLAVMFGFPILATIFGAFVLRSTDSLKEENFMKLITLALKINFKGLKTLNDKSGDK